MAREQELMKEQIRTEKQQASKLYGIININGGEFCLPYYNLYVPILHEFKCLFGIIKKSLLAGC